MKNCDRPIGLFDSGVGGLTVLKQIYRQMPSESILYFGDTARLPYGTKSPAEILQYVREIIDWMLTQGVKMVIMACNTSSALALEEVQREYKFPILGLIHPSSKKAVQEGQKIGVISTVATAKSDAYRRAIKEINSNVKVWQVGCPLFVPLIEQNRIYDPYTKTVAQEYLQYLIDKQIDTLIYGCTHYPHLENIIKQILPSRVKLIDPAQYVVESASRELDILNLQNKYSILPTRFCVSGNPEDFARISKQWLGFTPEVEKVYLQPQLNVVELPDSHNQKILSNNIYPESLIA